MYVLAINRIGIIAFIIFILLSIISTILFLKANISNAKNSISIVVLWIFSLNINMSFRYNRPIIIVYIIKLIMW